MKRWFPFAAAAAVLLAVALAVPALGAQALFPAAAGSPGTVYACVNSSHQFTHVSLASPMACPSQQPVSWPVTGAGSPSPSPTPTSPSPSPSPTSPSPSPSPSPTGSACTINIGGGCGFEDQSFWPGSNGYNTYVVDQALDVTGTGSVTASSPSDWSATGNYGSCGGCVQTFTAVQQLTNNWNSTAGNFTGSSDVPLSAVKSLTISYNESSPADAGDQYEFAPDIWTSYSGQLCGGCGDVMMWVDTSPQRCGAVGGWTLLGHPVLDGQNWTAYMAPGAAGGEIILVLDGAGGPGTCAQQSSGTIDVYAALQWLSANPGPSGFPALNTLTLSSLNTGWEITDAAGGTYQVNSLAYNLVTS